MDAQLLSELDADLLPAPGPSAGPLKWPSGAAKGIQKVSYSHAAMADMIVMEPTITQDELAARFGYSAPWVSQIICSDAFKALLASRRDKLVDPIIAASVKQQFEGLAMRCLEVLRAHTNQPADKVPPQLALQALKVSAAALGYGVRPEPARVEVNVTAQLELLGSNLEALLMRKRGVTLDQLPSQENASG